MKPILISVALSAFIVGAGTGALITMKVDVPAPIMAAAPMIDTDELASKIAKANMAELDARSDKARSEVNDYKCRMSGGTSPVCRR